MKRKTEQKLRKLIREEIKTFLSEETQLLNEDDRVIDFSGKIKVKLKEKLEQAARELDEELSQELFGRKVNITGKKPSGEKVKNVEGIVSGVEFEVTDELKLRSKVDLEEAGFTIVNPDVVRVVDTMGTNRRSSYYYI